ncbi:arabinogalactan protein, putative, partial [Ixodes scapularis]
TVPAAAYATAAGPSSAPAKDVSAGAETTTPSIPARAVPAISAPVIPAPTAPATPAVAPAGVLGVPAPVHVPAPPPLDHPQSPGYL